VAPQTQLTDLACAVSSHSGI